MGICCWIIVAILSLIIVVALIIFLVILFSDGSNTSNKDWMKDQTNMGYERKNLNVN